MDGEQASGCQIYRTEDALGPTDRLVGQCANFPVSEVTHPILSFRMVRVGALFAL